MKDLYLVNYSVKGIKTIDELVSLSFYKKTFSRSVDTKEYNVKGIYGMNGSGKSAIITSVDILRKILVDPGYLKNPIAQKDLDAIINKKDVSVKLTPQNKAKIETHTSPILSKASKILFSFCAYFS